MSHPRPLRFVRRTEPRRRYDPATRLHGFSGSDPTFLSIVASLGLTYVFGTRPWESRHSSDVWVVYLIAVVLGAMLLRPRSRMAWIAGAATALLTWPYFASAPYSRQEPWLFVIPTWVDRLQTYGRHLPAPFFVLVLLYLAPIVVATAAVRPDLGTGARMARAGSALVAAGLLWVLAWEFLPSLLARPDYVQRRAQVAVYLVPSAMTPLLVWRFTLARRLEVQWIGAALATPLVTVALCIPSMGRGWKAVADNPVGYAVLFLFACTGPVWAFWDRSARRRKTPPRGFDVVLSSSESPQQ
jgi:hypothetical protein